MEKVKIAAPAKINYTLKVGKRREDGFHPIESFMQAISLFDFLTLELRHDGKIELSGSSEEIPYDDRNIAYRAAEAYFKVSGQNLGVNIYIEKNIPVCAGLAGGSTDASAVLFGLNKLLKGMDYKDLHEICATLGSDLNFCLEGGAKICKGRGEILEEAEFIETPVTIVKPVGLKISAGEAYKRFDETNAESTMSNYLEFALLPHYEELRKLHALGFQMSGSGPSFFIKKAYLEPEIKEKLEKTHIIIENLKTVNHGAKIV